MYTEKEEIIITTIINEVLNVNLICHRYFHCLQQIILMWKSTCQLLSLQFLQVLWSKGICLGKQLQRGTHTLPVLYCNTPFKSKITTGMNSRVKASSGKARRYWEVLPLISICLQILSLYIQPNIAPPCQTTKAVRANMSMKFSIILQFRVVENTERRILSKYNASFGNNLVIFLFGFARKQ